MGGLPRPFSPWRQLTIWRREILCPNPAGCSYMAIEQYEEGAKHSFGICTKCGHHWRTEVLPHGPLRAPEKSAPAREARDDTE